MAEENTEDQTGIAGSAGLTTGSDIVGQQTGQESALSTWAGPYVTDTLGKAQALADQPYEAWTGPLTAGESDLQQEAFAGVAGLAMPENMGTYTPTSFTESDIQAQMNPFLENILNPQIARLKEEAEIQRLKNAARMTQAGSYGGSRQGILERGLTDDLLKNISETAGAGYASAYDKALAQFNLEQDKAKAAQEMANQYGMDVTDAKTRLGEIQRGIETEGIQADIDQFETERDYPLKMQQYLMNLASGLPMETQQMTYAEPSQLADLLGMFGKGGVGETLGQIIYGPEYSVTTGGTGGGTTNEIVEWLTGEGGQAFMDWWKGQQAEEQFDDYMDEIEGIEEWDYET